MSLDGTPLTPIQAGDGRWDMTAVAMHYMEPYMASGYEELARREYEESARMAAYAEAVALKEAKPTTIPEPAAAGGGTTFSFNPAHADPVYRATHPGMMDSWMQQEAMADQYGRIMAMKGMDEEML